MTIDISELRKVIADCYWPTSPVTINELLDRIEAAEKERDDLRAKIEEMEKQEPVAWTTRRALELVGRGTLGFHACGGNLWGEKGAPLYAIPGAQLAPIVPEGWKLVPIEPTEKMVNEGSWASALPGPRYIGEECAKQCWEYMIKAAPEAKP